MFSKIGKNLDILLYCFVLFIIIPLGYDNKLLDPALSPRLLSSSLLLVILPLFFLGKKNKSHDYVLQKINNSFGIFLFSVLFLSVLAFSVFKSINRGDAAVEYFKAYTGFALLLLSCYVLNNEQRIKIVIKSVQLSVVILIIFWLKQTVPAIIYAVKNHQQIVFGQQDASTLGNKNLFSEVLFMSLPFAALGIVSLKRYWRWISTFNTFSIILLIVILKSTAVWLALIVAVLFLLFLFLKYDKIQVKKFLSEGRFKKRKVILITSIFLFVGVFFIASSDFNFLKSKVKYVKAYFKNPELLNETSNINSNSLYERLLLWRNSWKLIKESPVSGCGLNNWKILYPKFGVSGTSHINAGWMHYEHPHNDYLLIWSESGVVALLAFILFFYFLLHYGIKMLRDGSPDNWLIMLMLAGIAGYLVINLFSFPRMRLYAWLILMLQAALIVSRNTVPAGEKKLTGYFLKPAIFIIPAISLWAVFVSFSLMQSERHSKRLLIAQQSRNYARMVHEADRAYSCYYPLDLNGTPIPWFKGMAHFYSNNIVEAKENFEKATEINPYHLQALNDLATCYDQNGEYSKAIEHYRKALAISPQFTDARYNLIAAYYNSEMYDSAFADIDKIPPPKTNYEKYDTYLPAILSGYSFEIIKTQDDTEQRSVFLEKIKDTKWLTAVYHQSKQENKPFANLLLKELNLNAK